MGPIRCYTWLTSTVLRHSPETDIPSESVLTDSHAHRDAHITIYLMDKQNKTGGTVEERGPTLAMFAAQHAQWLDTMHS